MKKRKFTVALIAISTLLLIMASTASAYVINPSWKRWGRNVVWSKDTYYYSSYDAPIQAAMNAWNNTNTKANIYYQANTWCDVSTRSLPNDTFLGRYTITPLYYNIVLNDYRISRHASENGYNKSNVIQSVMVHEWGHALGLGDVSGGTTMIMGSRRNRGTMITPRSDDINGVNSIYGAP